MALSAPDQDTIGAKDRGKQAVVEDKEEVVKETQMDEDVVNERVEVNVSHAGLAEGLRPLKKTNVVFNVSAQPRSEGPNSAKQWVLRDVTNSKEPSPHGPKVTRIIKGPHGLKRSIKSPYEKPTAAKHFANGSGRGRPPDPPDGNLNNKAAEQANPNGSRNFGEFSRSTSVGEDARQEENTGSSLAKDARQEDEGVPMEIPPEIVDAVGRDNSKVSQ